MHTYIATYGSCPLHTFVCAKISTIQHQWQVGTWRGRVSMWGFEGYSTFLIKKWELYKGMFSPHYLPIVPRIWEGDTKFNTGTWCFYHLNPPSMCLPFVIAWFPFYWDIAKMGSLCLDWVHARFCTLTHPGSGTSGDWEAWGFLSQELLVYCTWC